MKTIKNTVEEIKQRGKDFIEKYLNNKNDRNNFFGMQLTFA